MQHPQQQQPRFLLPRPKTSVTQICTLIFLAFLITVFSCYSFYAWHESYASTLTVFLIMCISFLVVTLLSPAMFFQE